MNMVNLVNVSEPTSVLLMLVPIVILAAALVFFVILPTKRQEKKDKELRDNLVVGDTIVTNAGIRGLVTQITDDTVTIETGGNRTKMIVEKWAIVKSLTYKD